MPGFTQVFGGTTIAPANASFLALTMAIDVDLAWPIEQAVNGDVVADTVEVNATAPGLNIDIPDARQVSTGYTTCFNNVGAQTVSVRNAVGATLLSLVPGTAWVIYLADNSTEGGTWRVFQLGASVSVAVAAALAGAGLRAILTTLNQDIPVTSFAATPTTLIDADRAKYMNWTGGLGTVNLPSAPVVGNGWYVQIRNSGSGDLTVTPPSGTIDGAVSKTFAAGTSAVVVTDGTNYLTLGFGSGSGGGSSFDFVEIDVAGSGTFALSGANLNRIAYRFIGILTGTRTIQVPAAIQQYWIANATTGAFSLFVKTAAQAAPGIEVLQNNQAILYCDGTNVIDADSSTVTFPIPVAQGGTGAITAAAARTNLGATAVGDAVFVAASQSAAQTAIGITLANPNTWAETQTLTKTATTGLNGALLLQSNAPLIGMYESDAAANNRLWSILANGEQLVFAARLDDGTTPVAWLVVDRTSTAIDTVNFQNGTLQYGGREVGYRNLPGFSFGGNYAPVVTDRAFLFRYTGAGGHTFSINNGVFSGDEVLTLLNAGSGNLTISGTITTLNWFNGSGTITTGGRTLAPGGWVSIWLQSSTVADVVGTGLS